MSFTPRAPKAIPTREYVEIELVFGKPEYKWKVPSYFTTSEQSRIKAVPYEHAQRFMTWELNKPLEEYGQESEDDKSVQDAFRAGKKAMAEKLIESLTKKSDVRTIPDDKDIDRVINRFLWPIGQGVLSDNVCKEQLDIICIPATKETPKVSTVFDEADREAMQDVLNFTYQTFIQKNEEQSSQEDSEQSETPSEIPTTEGNT